jgi:hypothetical protein
MRTFLIAITTTIWSVLAILDTIVLLFFHRERRSFELYSDLVSYRESFVYKFSIFIQPYLNFPFILSLLMVAGIAGLITCFALRPKVNHNSLKPTPFEFDNDSENPANKDRSAQTEGTEIA